jgi:protein-L-isoaspartate(D-aspartate) O-methyltransferase
VRTLDFELERKKLIDSLMRRKYISKPEVVSAMMKVQRHIFVPKEIERYAYNDSPQKIGSGQTISAPHMVGIMAEKLDLKPGHSVLEIGGGCGYHAAVVAEIVGEQGHVYSIELIKTLADWAQNNIKKCNLDERVTIIQGDGGLGLPEYAPYDRIYVTAASPEVPSTLIEQLKEKGKLLIPSGGRHFQTLIYCEKRGKKVIKKDYGGCVFVPLRGRYGFRGF